MSEHRTPLFCGILPNSQGLLLYLKITFYNSQKQAQWQLCLYSLTVADSVGVDT